MQYLFQLGHTTKLAQYELDNLLRLDGIKYAKSFVSPDLVLIETKSELDGVRLIERLGGSVRCAQVLLTRKDLSELLEQIVWELSRSTDQKRVEFGLSLIGDIDQNSSKLSQEIKQKLQQRKRPSRFVDSKSGLIQPIILKTQSVTEFILIRQDAGYILAKTIAVSDVQSWQQRDRDRPAVDAESGILPPKVARMMCNLALSSSQPDQIILDPFCGSGTIMMESLMLGHRVVGSDISAKAVADTQENLSWLESTYPNIGQWLVQEADISNLSLENLGGEKFDAVVTETYLGPSRFEYKQIPEVISELLPLYKKTLDQLKLFLKPKGRLVIAFPQFENKIESAKLHQILIDTSRETGYTQPIKPVLYGQRVARVKRLIYTFELA